ncbi:MAG: TlpA family protein disulfide reductase [Gammaproteobacteria bacterium]|nr:TlpA family protein disulfide reductase [Gammaproteobacteria bacterium]
MNLQRLFFCCAMIFSLPAYSTVLLNEVDREVPQYSLPDTQGKLWTSEAMQGKPYIVNFWASWCPPCVEELPAMNSLWKKLEPHGVGMLAINAGEGLPAVNEFLTRIPIDFPVLIGDGRSLNQWQGRAMPSTYIIDGAGRVVYEAIGPREWDDEEFVKKMLTLL